MRKTTFLVSMLFAGSLSGAASAQPVPKPGFQADRFNPSERGSEWFALDTLDLRGNMRPAVGVVGEWANLPFVLYNADGSTRAKVVEQQMFIHAGASLVLFDRLRLGINVPFAVIDKGVAGVSLHNNLFGGPDHLALGDIRYAADLRLLGEYASPFTLALGGQVFAPTGEAKEYTSDDSAHGIIHLSAAGEASVFVWALKTGFHIRARQTDVDGSAYGNAWMFGAAAGVRVANRHLVVGPEIYGETNVGQSGQAFAKGTTPVEALLGAHYTIGEDWRIGAGAGPGITRDLGSPQVRVMGSLEWTPGYHPPPPPEPAKVVPPPDRDGDGIIDAEDACPDTPGIKTSDPKTNGCPPPPADRDGDGIPDSEDACPDKAGVKTSDPKTNGCPPDKDGDGIVDSEDACPDVPGVKTDDPKTNGCPPPPPDRDGDGIVDADDACPDAPGPKTEDPKTNGCPMAAVVNGQIKISEQVKFATGSAKILADSDTLLTAVTKVITDHPEITKLRIEGHTDNVGKAAMNKTLSQKRAESVMAWLVKHGVDKKRLTAQGFGMDRPIDDNTTEAGRKNNRRVEFHIE